MKTLAEHYTEALKLLETEPGGLGCSLLQRKLQCGYFRAEKVLMMLEAAGVIRDTGAGHYDIVQDARNQPA